MSAIEAIRGFHDELTAIRRDLHAHPELGLDEHRTAEIVAAKLQQRGIEVHRGIGKPAWSACCGVGSGNRSACAPTWTACRWRSRPICPIAAAAPGACTPAAMTATPPCCWAPRHVPRGVAGLRRHRAFHLPAGRGGRRRGARHARRTGLFERISLRCDLAMHNRPGMPVGTVRDRQGAAVGRRRVLRYHRHRAGSHGARPELSVDPVLVAGHIITALQSIVARNVPPADTAVLSVTRIVAGDAYNIIPQTAKISRHGARLQRDDGADRAGMRRIAKGVADGFRAEAEVDFRIIFAPLINAEAQDRHHRAMRLRRLVGEANVDRAKPPSMGSEDPAPPWRRCPVPISRSATATAPGCTTRPTTSRRGNALRGGTAGDGGGAAARAVATIRAKLLCVTPGSRL